MVSICWKIVPFEARLNALDFGVEDRRGFERHTLDILILKRL